MARTGRIKAEGSAFYHVTSRITGKQFLLKSTRIKELMLSSLKRAAIFSGVKIGAFCIMDDHFHILFQIPAFDTSTLTESDILNRIEALSGRKRAETLHEHWQHLRSRGDTPLIEAELNRYRTRMYDLSEFVKTFKEEFRRAFQHECDYSGRLWGDRFFSTLIHSAEYLKKCAAYIEMNPVRAGLSNRVCAYRWSTSGLSAQGDSFAISCKEWLMTIGSGDTPYDEQWLMSRWSPISKGKLLGSAQFVAEAVQKYQNKLFSHSLRARSIVAGMFASHGYKVKKVGKRSIA